MRKFSRLCFLFCLLAVSCRPGGGSTSYSDDLAVLDEALAHADEYVKIKEQKIKTIENMLHSRGVTPLQQYSIYGQLYEEYEAYQFDKALKMLDCQTRLAEEMGSVRLQKEVTLKRALLLTVTGLYLEADKIFREIDTTALDHCQKLDWYYARQKFLTDYSEYLRTAEIEIPDVDKIDWYQDRIIESTPAHSKTNRHLRLMKLIRAEKYEQAAVENYRILSSIDPNTREYAVQTYWQGYICDESGRSDEAISWWVKSAVCDCHNAIKDNASICTIAIKLTDPQETERSFGYIRQALNDAVFFNGHLRRIQVASNMPWMLEKYSAFKMMQQGRDVRVLVWMSVIALLLAVITVWVIYLQLKSRKASRVIELKNARLAEYNRSIEDAERNLRRVNRELMEANEAKEEYLGLFLSMSSGYLDKLRKALPREQYEAELRNFYKTFDTSFLQLYPTFVDEFNSLLRKEARITLKDGELLSTELRIFALIKLGITQSSHIASLLRYSVNTIYNYRAQIKNVALEDRENFEESVCRIGSKR